MDIHPQLQFTEDATDGTPLLSSWLEGMSKASIAATAAEAVVHTKRSPSQAAQMIAVKLLPGLDVKPTSTAVFPQCQFHKEMPDRYGSDAAVVLDVPTGHGTFVRHALRVQVKVGRDTGEVSRMPINDAARILDRMHEPFRSDCTGDEKHSLLSSPLTRATSKPEAIVVWNCLVTCKHVGGVGELARALAVVSAASARMWHPPTGNEVMESAASAGIPWSTENAALAASSFHPFKSEARGVPVFVVPIVADHKVMLNLWPKEVRAFAKKVGIPNYSMC